MSMSLNAHLTLLVTPFSVLDKVTVTYTHHEGKTTYEGLVISTTTTLTPDQKPVVSFVTVRFPDHEDRDFERTDTGWKESVVDIAVEIAPVRPPKTCDTCPATAEECEWRDDDYNTNGDCLAEK